MRRSRCTRGWETSEARARSAVPYSAVPYSAAPFSAVPYSAAPYSAVPYQDDLRDGSAVVTGITRSGAWPIRSDASDEVLHESPAVGFVSYARRHQPYITRRAPAVQDPVRGASSLAVRQEQRGR